MAFKCSECASTFRQKKNLYQHLRKEHGLKKYKCDNCNFRADNQSNLKKHEKSKHLNYLLKCKDCNYTTSDRSNLNRHVRSNHIDRNLKCDLCEFHTDRQENMKRHINAKHPIKNCNECEFQSYSTKELQKHKTTEHEPDDFEEESAFDRLIYKKTWKVRGFKDPISTLNAYKSKVKNTVTHYLESKGAMKWYIGMQVKMYKESGETRQEASPGFTSNPKTTLSLWNFEDLYKSSFDKILNDFIEFNANGSGWILERVENLSINIAGYQPIATYSDDSDDESDIGDHEEL